VISKLVRRADMRVSTPRDLIAATSGELQISAAFADRSLEIGNFRGRSEKDNFLIQVS
jgi:hypothetical protein